MKMPNVKIYDEIAENITCIVPIDTHGERCDILSVYGDTMTRSGCRHAYCDMVGRKDSVR